MDQVEIKMVIAKYFKSIKKYFDKLGTNFEREELHLLWQEMKRLRAFLRIINLELSEEIELKLPLELKTVYGYIGIIQDFQWLLQHIKIIEEKEGKKHDEYVRHLKNAIENWKAKLKNAISKNPLPEAEEKIVARLPHCLHQTTIEKFVHQKITIINEHLSENHEQDEKLHTIRKNLRDILYNISIFKNDLGVAFPVKLWNETELKNIENIAHELEVFDDLCNAIDFLAPIHLVEISTKEKKSLMLIKKQWLMDKEQAKKNILNQLENYHQSIIATISHHTH